MTIVVDRRQTNRNKSADNRKRFIERCKGVIKKQVKKMVEKEDISTISKKKPKVKVPKRTISEPTFEKNYKTGKRDITLPGNDKFRKGDVIDKPNGGEGNGYAGSNSDEISEDNFEFVLSREEFLDLLFEGMWLPAFIKENNMNNVKYVRQRAGYAKHGMMSKLDLKKSMEQAIARRIGTMATIQNKIDNTEDELELEELKKKKPIFLDDVDLRYRLHVKYPKPFRSAAMFCIMDVSGSMNEERKMMAKKFFLLLYLFLSKTYDNVDIIFIRHHTTAKEVTEHEFFYSKETGGTVVSTAFELMDKIVKERYDPNDWNLYVAQASDGDNFQYDNEELLKVLTTKILPMIQYMAYIQTNSEEDEEWKEQWRELWGDDLYSTYDAIDDKKLNKAKIHDELDAYRTLYNLFSEED